MMKKKSFSRRETDLPKRMEEALLESELNIRNMADQLADVLFATNDSGFITFVSPSALQMFGWKPEEMAGRSFIEFLRESEIPGAVAQFKDTLASGRKTQNFSCVMKRKDESTFPGEVNSSIVLKDGHTVGKVGVIRDITERMQTEEALRRAEENFRRSLDESPLGVRIVTIEGETIYANSAILDIYGYDSIEELQTTSIKNRYTRESYAEFRIRREKRKQGVDVPSEYTIDIIRKNGDVRHLRVFRKDILWDDEKQYQAIYQDITEQRQAEEKLAAESRHLEETNAALRVLLRHREEDMREMEQKVVANVKKLVLPYVEELRKLRLNPSQLSYLDIIDSNLQQVINPFLQNLTARFSVLTPREIQVSNLIRSGKTSKEIADLIKAAPRSVEFHRNNIRKKLGLGGKKTNLRSFLLTLS